MAGPTTEVIADDLKDLRTEIHSVAVSLAELRAEFRFSLALAKWAGALLVTTILTGGVAGVWWASWISAEVKHLAEVVATLKPQPPAQPQPSPIQPGPAPKAE